MSLEPSVDPSSTTISSTWGWFCPSTLPTASSTQDAALRQGMTTEISAGSKWSIRLLVNEDAGFPDWIFRVDLMPTVHWFWGLSVVWAGMQSEG
jgi:hypothetical protein